MFELDLTRVDYTWQPAGESQSNTFTAQNIFKSPSATVAGGVFQSSGTVSAIPAGYGGSTIVAQFLAEESSAFPYTLYEATGNTQGHILAFRQSRGTYSARTATQSGDILGQLNFGGHNGASLVDGKASIRAVAAQTWTTTANGTNFEIYTTATGSTTSGQRVVITGTSMSIQVPTTVDTRVSIDQSSGNAKQLRFQTSSSLRWIVQSNATAETGSNAGSDFRIEAYSDAGASLFNALSITRASGNATFNNLVNCPQLAITTSNPPASATATGSAGMIRWDANYIYVCTATDTWKRVAIATWP
jgi:hypothetical protein